jgi:hypothetical protein
MPLTIPKFANENEEADWWYENREQLAEESLANVEGRKRRTGTAMKMAMVAQGGLGGLRFDHVVRLSRAR